MAAFCEKLTIATLWLVFFIVLAYVLCHWSDIRDYIRQSMNFEKTVILKSKGSALNDHVANYVNENNLRRFWPGITIDFLRSLLTGSGGLYVKEISLMGGFLRIREFLSPEQSHRLISRGSGPSDVGRPCYLIVVALISPSHYVTIRELYLSKMCEKMSNLKFFSIYFDGSLAHSSFAVQQIRAAVTHLKTAYPNCFFTAIACSHEADILLNYLGDTGAACKFESAVLLAPTCQFGAQRKITPKSRDCLETKNRSGKLRKISLQEVNTINFEQIRGDVNESTADNLNVLYPNVTPKNSSGNIFNAFLPDNVDDVAIPVLWIPEQRAEGSIAPVELFEESINFMLLRLDAVVRCRLDLWQNAIQFAIAVHSFFHPSNNGCATKTNRVRRK